jgi:alkanesulfonate monooxygenase SsuD/methylene tetrahydromethanopterin reductase-like flavin-dependent oxidoreductase (luciferase family)
MLRRSEDEVRARLPIGSPARCADLFARYQAAGVGRALLWPVGDELEQIERFAAEVIPAVQAARDGP